jgi:hypothetical protein
LRHCNNYRAGMGVFAKRWSLVKSKRAMTNFDRQALHQFLTHRYDLEGLKTLCHYLEVDYENLDGRTKDILARELIRYMERVERVGELVAMQSQAEAALARRDVPPERLYKITHDPRRVFISHAHQDAAFAHRLAADLERNGFPVWIAPESIRPGEQWLPAIARGLQESGVCAVVLTPDGVASSWVEYETNLAISRERKKQMQLLLLDVAECDAPFGWAGYQYLQFRGDYEDGLAALRVAVSRFSDLSADATKATDHGPKAKSVIIAPTVSEFPHSPANSDRLIHEKTGIELVRIPAGHYINRYGLRDLLPEFWIGRFPVTNAQYKKFIDENPLHKLPKTEISYAWSFRDYADEEPYHWDEKRRTHPKGLSEHPVVLVDWHDIQAFLSWAGLRLPSEDEWEKAARGGEERLFPWGNDWRDKHSNTLEAGRRWTSQVGFYSPHGDSLYGCADMAGNVWEWTSSLYRRDDDAHRVIRGGSYANDWEQARTDYREMSPPVTEAKSTEKKRSVTRLNGWPHLSFRVALSGKRDLRTLWLSLVRR